MRIRKNSYKIGDIINNKKILDIKSNECIIKSGKSKGLVSYTYTYIVKCMHCGHICEYSGHTSLKTCAKDSCKYCWDEKYKNKIIGPYKFLYKTDKKMRNDRLWKCICMNCGNITYKVPTQIEYDLRKKHIIGKYCVKCSPTHKNVLTKEARKKVAISSKETIAKQYTGQLNHYNHKGMPRNIVWVNNKYTSTIWLCGQWRYKSKTYRKCSTNLWECIAFIIAKKLELGVWKIEDATTYLDTARQIIDTHIELKDKYNSNAYTKVGPLLKNFNFI